MKRNSSYAILLILIFNAARGYSQHLDQVVPVSISQNNLSSTDLRSFVLSAVDYKFYLGKQTQYKNTLQIVDAAQPWPPRWFTMSPFDMNEYTQVGESTTLLDASVQNGKMTFYSLIDTRETDGGAGLKQAYLSCDKNLQFTDTFTTTQRAVDGHDFKVSSSGEKLYFLPLDTTVDMSAFTGDSLDKKIKIFYEEIQIADKSGKVIFHWNPLRQFGLEATYLPYRFVEALISNRNQYGWSHGNSLGWDEDGNILYSFKNIGIGKISRADGHIIWQVDRKKQKINKKSDELPIYLQHSFQWLKDATGNTYYTILSNGDSLHQYCAAYHFTVKMQDGEPVVKIIKKIKPSVDLPNTLGGGNYDLDPDGNYVLNYGAFWAKDTTVGRPVFEYGNDKKMLSQYTVPYTVICFKVHTYKNPRPPRPQIKATGNELTATGLKNYKWFKLSGKDLKRVTEVGSGPTYKASEKGVYCVTAKYGIGCSVSEPFEIK